MIDLSRLVVQIWTIDRLLPYIRNARTHSDEQVAQVAASIREFGWTNPIIVGGDGVIIAGHARLAAARKLRMSEVPVIVLDHLTEAQRRALVLADNKLALNAGWDEETLRVELQSLQEAVSISTSWVSRTRSWKICCAIRRTPTLGSPMRTPFPTSRSAR